MFTKTTFFNGLAELFNDVDEFAKNPDAAFLAEIAPYCDSLGILVPELPNIPYFVKQVVGSLGKELLNMNSAKSAGPLSESLIEDTKTKAFALHQIAGIMEKYGKIKPQTCVEYRRDTFLNAISAIDTIKAAKTPVDFVGEVWDTVKEVFRETVKEPLKDEARQFVKDEYKQRNKADQTEEQKKEDKPVEVKKSIQETLDTAKSYVKAGLAATDLKKTLTQGGGYNHEKHDAYVTTMNTYLDTRDKNQRLKVASKALYVQDAKITLEEQVNKVAKGELGGGFMEKASSFFNNLMTKAHTVLDFSFDLRAIQNKLQAKNAVINGQLEKLSKDDASFNINDLEGHNRIVNNQRPTDIYAEIEDLRHRANIEGNDDEDFYNALNQEEEKARLLETKCNLLDKKIDEATQNLKSLQSDVSDYIISRKDAWLTDLINEIIDTPEEKTRDAKISAAKQLQKEIQSGPQKYTDVQQKAAKEGNLGKEAYRFNGYKNRFFKEVGEIKSDCNLEESSKAKMK